MTALLVSLDAGSSALQRSVLASVPGRFVVTDDGAADVVVVSGRRPSWPDDVARSIEAGARGVLVTTPGIVRPDRVRDLAESAAGRAVVAVDTPYAPDRTWAAVEDEVAFDAATAAIVDSVLTVPAGRGGGTAGALLDQLAVVRPLIRATGTLRLTYRGERQYVLTARTLEPRVTLTGVTSAAGHAALTLDVVSAGRRWQIRFDDTQAAVPTEVTVHDAAGTRTRPLLYESGRRVTWERLHRALNGDGEVAYPLERLADDMDVAHRVLG